MRGMVPVIMAGILGIYGLIVAVIVSSNVKQGNQYTLSAGLMHLGAGITGGLSSLAAGFAIGMVGDACCAAYQRTEVCDTHTHTHTHTTTHWHTPQSIFVAMILILIFAEALGLYGMIISLLMNSTASSVKGDCSLAPWTHAK